MNKEPETFQEACENVVKAWDELVKTIKEEFTKVHDELFKE